MLNAPGFRRLTTGSPTRSRRAVLPRLEGLEDWRLLSTVPVTNLSDSGYGSLPWAIGVAKSGDTINFAKGLHGTITLASDLLISDSVTIDGPGANKLSVSGDDANRIFDISGSASVTVTGLTITDGEATSGGGILLEGGASLDLSNCTVSQNVASGGTAGTGFGGGMEDTSSGTLTVTNCTFDANKAIATGPNEPAIVTKLGFLPPGYIQALGGAIDVSFVSTSTATISNSTFTGNQALGGVPGASAGGGALSDSSLYNATMTVTGCTLSGNAAIGAAGGGGVNNTVNFGSGQGGGINDFASVIVRDSTLTDNLAQGSVLAPGVASSIGSAVPGGGIFCLTNVIPATLMVADSTLAGNQAVGGAGATGNAGSVGEGGGISVVFASASVDGCTLADNVAQGGAGGSGAVGGPGASGGIDLAVDSSVTVSNTVLINNQAIGGAGGSGDTGGDGVGGGINVGSGVFIGFSPGNSSLTLTDSIFVGNQAIGGAGGSGSNGGAGQGGGLSVLVGSSASIDSTCIRFNAALGGGAGTGGVSGQGSGGGLYIGTTADVTLDTSTDVIFNFASTRNDNIFGSYTRS